MGYLLDTNMVTAILKENSKVTDKLESLNRQNQEVFISAMTYYETTRNKSWIFLKLIICWIPQLI
jgi:tRNA(fMet)-specific endonuclease VapC